MKKIATAMLATAGAAGALVGLTASPAAADTKSCSFYGGGNVAGQYVPAGSFCMTRVGSGRWITGIQDEFYGYKVCNYDVTGEFFTNNWTWKRTVVSSRNYGCSYGTKWMPWIGVHNSIQGLTGTSTGYLCSTLRVAGQRVTSSCQYIY